MDEKYKNYFLMFMKTNHLESIDIDYDRLGGLKLNPDIQNKDTLKIMLKNICDENQKANLKLTINKVGEEIVIIEINKKKGLSWEEGKNKIIIN